MKRFAVLTTVLAVVLTLVFPFAGGGGTDLSTTSRSDAPSASSAPGRAQPIVDPVSAASAASAAATTIGAPVGETPAGGAGDGAGTTAPDPVVVPAPTTVGATVVTVQQTPAPVAVESPTAVASKAAVTRSDPGVAVSLSGGGVAAVAAGTVCSSGAVGGGSAPGVGESGIGGTTTGDIQSFSAAVNTIRVANCLQPIAATNFRYDSCMEQRLFWMAEDPSSNPGNTWGHTGVKSIAPDAAGVYYSDAVPSRGCDGNLAGGSGDTGATVAQKWWDSLPHRASLYRPTVTGSTAGVCIYFAMTHGGIPSEGPGYTRASARWGGC